MKTEYIKYLAIKRITVTALGAMALLATTSFSSKAQLNPFQSVYFQNRYLINPAMAGMEPGLNLNLGYRQQWNQFPGSPKNQNLTAEYQPTDRVGVGVNVTSDKAGLIQQTRVMATYAYHLPIGGKGQKLNFGLSLGVQDPSIDYSGVNGDQSDVQIANYNQLKAYVDGDFGVAYTDQHLIIEGAIPNLKTAFFNNQDDRINVDRNVFMVAASYKLFFKGDEFSLEPKVMFRQVKGYDDIYDGGLNLKINTVGLTFQGIYHSTKNVGMGIGLDEHAFGLNIGYNLETGPLRSYTPGGFEFGLKLKLFAKSK